MWQEACLMPGCFSTGFLLGCNENLLLTSQRHTIPVWGCSEQSLPPLIAPEASSRFSNKGILAVIYPNYRNTCPKGSMSGKLGNSATAISMGCILERVLYYIIHDHLKVWWANYTHQDRGKKYKWLLHLCVPGCGQISPGSFLVCRRNLTRTCLQLLLTPQL